MVKIENPKGAITIEDEVFANLAGDAATSCFGVKAMAAQGRDGGIFQLKRENMSKGVKAQLGEDGSVSLELHIAVDHGVNLNTLCNSIMNEVSYKVSKATGVPVRSVDVYVDTMLIDGKKKTVEVLPLERTYRCGGIPRHYPVRERRTGTEPAVNQRA